MKIIVQKFGGTSVSTKEMREHAFRHIEQAVAEDYGVVVVVSAMGRKGDPFATDTLLSVVDSIHDTSRRDLDILMSCGEAISAVVFATELRNRGIQVTVLSGAQAGIFTNDEYSRARIHEIRPNRVLNALASGEVVVVMGFQGVTPDGDTTTLGRGGSDTTATALGVALGAEVVDIFTDVDGIMTADPRIVSEARRLPTVTYAEICNLAYQGAKVIHPRAVEIAMQKNVPIRVRSTTSDDEGTLVTNVTHTLEQSILNDRYVTGVTQNPHVTQILIELQGVPSTDVFREMADERISLDLISVGPARVAFTVADAEAKRAVESLKKLGLEPELRPDCARLAVVGAGIAGVPGIMARIVAALAAKEIGILQSADSHTTIWVLVRGEDMETAVQALHREFCL